MNLPEIQQALASLAYSHPLSDTNVLSVENVGTDISFVTDESDLRNEIADLTKERDEALAEAKKLQDDFDALEAKHETLEEKLGEVRDPESGVTLATMIERMDEAEKSENEWRELVRKHDYAAKAAQTECVALRKRKGVDAGIVRYSRDVTTLLHYITQAPIERLNGYREDCAKMLEKINAA